MVGCRPTVDRSRCSYVPLADASPNQISQRSPPTPSHLRFLSARPTRRLNTGPSLDPIVLDTRHEGIRWLRFQAVGYRVGKRRKNPQTPRVSLNVGQVSSTPLSFVFHFDTRASCFTYTPRFPLVFRLFPRFLALSYFPHPSSTYLNVSPPSHTASRFGAPHPIAFVCVSLYLNKVLPWLFCELEFFSHDHEHRARKKMGEN